MGGSSGEEKVYIGDFGQGLGRVIRSEMDVSIDNLES